MSSLSLQNISKFYRGIRAVEDLCLQMRSGEILALLGPSGCGKSTTLHLIAGALRPDRGDIYLGERSLRGVPPERRGMALVLQGGLLFPHLNVGENVAFGLKMRGESRPIREAKALAMLGRVQLQGFAERPIGSLSGGQAQRVALARALVTQPQVLLLDEPLSALDASLREEMQELIRQLQADTGVTMVLVTHDQAEAVSLAHRIGLMLEGQLQQLGSAEDFYLRPQSPLVARFFGGVNFLVGTVAPPGWLHLAGGSLRAKISVSGPVQVTIRPERVEVFAERPALDNLLGASLVASRFCGTQTRLTLRLEDGEVLQAWIPPNQGFSPGQSVWARLPSEALHGWPTASSYDLSLRG